MTGTRISPIALFVFNRPWHTRQTLMSLMQNRLAGQSKLYIFSDGPKLGSSGEEIEKILQVRQVIREKQWCKDVHIIESESNKGLADSIVDGVTQIVNEHGKIIVLEDDIITSEGFLEYMNDALDLYENEEKVMHISGYMYPHNEKLPDTFFFNVPYPGGGWGTWQRAWKHYIADENYLFNYFNTARRWHIFNKFGSDFLQIQLVRNCTGDLKTWFIKWHGTMLIYGGHTLYPGWSLTNNIGFDSTGIHSPTINKYNIELLAGKVKVKSIPINESRKVKKIIKKFYLGPFKIKESVYSFVTFFIKKETIRKIKINLRAKLYFSLLQ